MIIINIYWKRTIFKFQRLKLLKNKYALINEVLQKAKSIRAWSPKYAHIEKIENEADLKAVPPLNKYELLSAYPELFEQIMQSNQKAIVMATGGSTHEPITAFAPNHLFIKEITSNWRPITHADIFANLLSTGRLWIGYTFFNLLASAFAGITLPVGGLSKDDLDVWIPFLVKNKATILGLNPSALRIILEYLLDKKITLPAVKKIIWGGEPFDMSLYELKQETLPAAELWGLYGSAEVFSIGNNTPSDSRDTFLIHDFQHIEVGEKGEILSTNFHPDYPSIALRFEVGDRGELDETGTRLRLLGRQDEEFKIGMIFFSGTDLINLLRSFPEVENAQLAIFQSPKTGREILELHILPKKNQWPDPNNIKHELATKSFLVNCRFDVEQLVKIYIVPEMWHNPRTNKVPIAAPAKGET